jgi:hypothetical protein
MNGEKMRTGWRQPWPISRYSYIENEDDDVNLDEDSQ